MSLSTRSVATEAVTVQCVPVSAPQLPSPSVATAPAQLSNGMDTSTHAQLSSSMDTSAPVQLSSSMDTSTPVQPSGNIHRLTLNRSADVRCRVTPIAPAYDYAEPDLVTAVKGKRARSLSAKGERQSSRKKSRRRPAADGLSLRPLDAARVIEEFVCLQGNHANTPLLCLLFCSISILKCIPCL